VRTSQFIPMGCQVMLEFHPVDYDDLIMVVAPVRGSSPSSALSATRLVVFRCASKRATGLTVCGKALLVRRNLTGLYV
jgi:hypothetical protein